MRARRGRVARAVAMAAALAAGTGAVGACGGGSGVPPALRGRWVADTGRHAGLAFEVTCRRLLIQQADGFTAHAIDGVAVAERGGRTVFDVTVTLESGQPDRVRLVRGPGSDALRFGRSPERWARHDAAAVPWSALPRDRCP